MLLNYLVKMNCLSKFQVFPIKKWLNKSSVEMTNMLMVWYLQAAGFILQLVIISKPHVNDQVSVSTVFSK